MASQAANFNFSAQLPFIFIIPSWQSGGGGGFSSPYPKCSGAFNYVVLTMAGRRLTGLMAGWLGWERWSGLQDHRQEGKKASHRRTLHWMLSSGRTTARTKYDQGGKMGIKNTSKTRGLPGKSSYIISKVRRGKWEERDSLGTAMTYWKREWMLLFAVWHNI